MDARVQKCFLCEGIFADIPGTFSPYVVCSSHNIQVTNGDPSLLSVNEIGIVSLCPGYAGEKLLIGQKSSISQRAKRTDHNKHRVDCFSGTP